MSNQSRGDRWHRVEELFHAVRSMPPDQRASFLSAACVENDSLRQEVEALLAVAEDAEGSLETTASDPDMTSPGTVPGSLVGRRVGLPGEGQGVARGGGRPHVHGAAEIGQAGQHRLEAAPPAAAGRRVVDHQEAPGDAGMRQRIGHDGGDHKVLSR